MNSNEAMDERTKMVGVTWKYQGQGYYTGIGKNPHMGLPVAYIVLPDNHPDVGTSYDDLKAPVNGGLTFGQGAMYGWDYGHFRNDGSPEVDVLNALKFFLSRESPSSPAPPSPPVGNTIKIVCPCCHGSKSCREDWCEGLGWIWATAWAYR